MTRAPLCPRLQRRDDARVKHLLVPSTVISTSIMTRILVPSTVFARIHGVQRVHYSFMLCLSQPQWVCPRKFGAAETWRWRQLSEEGGWSSARRTGIRTRFSSGVLINTRAKRRCDSETERRRIRAPCRGLHDARSSRHVRILHLGR